MQSAHVTQELPAKAKHVSANGDEDKGEAAIVHCIALCAMVHGTVVTTVT